MFAVEDRIRTCMGFTLLDTLPLARRFYISIIPPSGICVYHSAT